MRGRRQPVVANEPMVSVPVAYAFMGLTVLLFATAYAGIRFMLDTMDAMPFTSLRLTMAAMALGAMGVLLRIHRPALTDLPRIIAAGLCGFTFYHIALNYGAATISAGQASLLASTIPLWTAFAAWKILGEVVERRHWLGLVVSVVGVAVMTLTPGELSIPFGTLFVLLSAMFGGVNIVLQKSLLSRYRPFDLTVWVILFGSLPLILWMPTQVEAVASLSSTHWAVMLYLSLVPIGIGYWISTIALTALPAYRQSQFLLLVPPVAALVAWLVLGEVPTARMALGGLVVLLGVAVTLRRKPRPAPARAPT